MFSTGVNNRGASNNAQFHFPGDGVDPTFFTSPQQSTPANAFGGAGIDESPFIDYLDGDNSFDFDNADGDMIGALPGDSPGRNGEDSNEKRKNPDDDDDDDDEGGGKRREGEDKKKPGRKPLTNEPTTVGSARGETVHYHQY
jgi:AP-1-like factor